MSPLFGNKGNKEEKAAQQAAASAEIERLCALPVADLAVDILATVNPSASGPHAGFPVHPCRTDIGSRWPPTPGLCRSASIDVPAIDLKPGVEGAPWARGGPGLPSNSRDHSALRPGHCAGSVRRCGDVAEKHSAVEVRGGGVAGELY
jgi:hypothetical protein